MGQERKSKIKEKQHRKKGKCSKCKCEYDILDAKEESYKCGNKVFYDCHECGSQVVLK